MRALARILFAATCGMFVLQAILLGASPYPVLSSQVLVDQAFPLVGLGAVIGAGIGLLIVTSYPRNLIGWLFLVGQLGSITGLTADAFVLLIESGTVDAPWAGQLASVIKGMFDATYTMVILSIIFMIAPDGRLLSPRWRFALAVPIVAFLLRLTVLFTQPLGPVDANRAIQPTGLAVALLLLDVLALLGALALGVTALVIRMRKATVQQRAQLSWVASAAAVLAVALFLYILGQLLLTPAPWPLAEVLYLAYIYVSVAVGVAILRYRLWDIDVILSRAIVLAVLVAFVTVGYIAVVVLIGAVLTAAGAPGTSLYWPSLVATALVAVAFQPLRRHVVRLADQLVYGRRAQPYEALATLSRRLADASTPEGVPITVAQATGRAVGAVSTRVTIGPDEPPTSGTDASWNAATTVGRPSRAADVVLPVLDVGERVGTIEVWMPPGRSLRGFEHRLVQDVAAQAGIAFRNALLQAELAARVAEGRERSAELAASRRRLVGAEDEARARLADDIRLRVIPHLSTVAVAARAVALDERDCTEDLLDELIGSTEKAVQELRAVCRGVFPALLERRGLVPALTDRLAVTQPTATLVVEEPADRRLAPAVEAAGYVFCAEVASTGRLRTLRIAVDGGAVVITAVLAGNGSGKEAGDRQHAQDRIAALGGRITTRDCADGRRDVEVRAWIPLLDQNSEDAAAQTFSSSAGPKADLGR